MNSLKNTFQIIILLSLAFLWGFVARSKLSDSALFFRQLKGEGLTDSLAHFLSYGIPIIAILAGLSSAAGGLFVRLRLVAFLLSTLLLSSFTAYMVIAVKLASTPPCSCIALGADVSWDNQLYLSALMLIFSVYGLLISLKGRSRRKIEVLET